jgi:hypothetical protein
MMWNVTVWRLVSQSNENSINMCCYETVEAYWFKKYNHDNISWLLQWSLVEQEKPLQLYNLSGKNKFVVLMVAMVANESPVRIQTISKSLMCCCFVNLYCCLWRYFICLWLLGMTCRIGEHCICLPCCPCPLVSSVASLVSPEIRIIETLWHHSVKLLILIESDEFQSWRLWLSLVRLVLFLVLPEFSVSVL